MRHFALTFTLAVFATISFATNTDNHSLGFTIPAVDELALSGTTSAISLTTPTAGTVFAVDTSTGSSLALTTNNNLTRAVEVSLDSDMPAGTKLEVTATDGTLTTDNLAFTGGTFTNNGTVDITDSSKTAVELAQVKEQARTSMAITYTLTVSLEADAADSGSRTVIYTITAP